MINARMLTADGIALYANWLSAPTGTQPPEALLMDEGLSTPFGNYEIDEVKTFTSRLEFGMYLDELFRHADFHGLMSPDTDGLWAWLTAVYFAQFSEKGIRRQEHYLVTRKGSAGSLAYRNAARTSYELAHIHGRNAEICLRSPMHTYGDMTEQMASRQTIAHNRGFFQTAFDMYMNDGKLRRGAASKPKKPKERKAGDRTGLGSVRRLAIALQRLDLTYDTAEMPSSLMQSVLPKEFANWNRGA